MSGSIVKKIIKVCSYAAVGFAVAFLGMVTYFSKNNSSTLQFNPDLPSVSADTPAGGSAPGTGSPVSGDCGGGGGCGI